MQAIWLVRIVCKYLNNAFYMRDGAYQSATNLALLLYPEIVEKGKIKEDLAKEKPRLKLWLDYADKQISHTRSIYNAFLGWAPELLIELQAQGIDITDNLTGSDPMLFGSTNSLAFLQLFINAGANLNERDEIGNTFLHEILGVIQRRFITKEGQKVRTATGDTIIIPPYNQQDSYNLVLMFERALAAGANPKVKNDQGKSVLDLAKEFLQEAQKKNDEGKIYYFSQIMKLLVPYFT